MSQTATLSQLETQAPTLELDQLGPGEASSGAGGKVPHDGIVVANPVKSRNGGVGEAAAITNPPVPDTPPNAQNEAERWNRPKGNIVRLIFASLSFVIAGIDSICKLLPFLKLVMRMGLTDIWQLESYYDLSYTIVSLIFLTPFAGYAVASFTNARIHMRFGQRGVALAAPLCHAATFAALAAHPPYPALVALNVLSGFGNGLTDACFCAWVGGMDKANAIQGIMHSCYSLGALMAPLIATNMVVTAGLPWYTYYYVMVGLAVVEWVGLTLSFWRKTGEVYRREHRGQGETIAGSGTREALKNKVTWLCSLFFFAYMGVEVGLGGWVVTFMLRVREASAYASGVSGSGFWAGMVVGRAGLGFVTERFGERLCIAVYLAASVGLHLLFWLVPRFAVSAAAVSLLGVFLGPLFPGAVMVTTKLLPRHMHVTAIGFAMAMGGTGGTVFPFAIGAIASSRGVGVLMPIILALIIFIAGVWLSFPRVEKKK